MPPPHHASPRSFRLGELVQVAEGELYGGDPELVIRGVAEIDKAEVGQITYAVSERYASGVRTTAASAVVVPRDLELGEDVDKALIRTDNPYWSFARILELFTPEVPEPAEAIHPSAVVEPDAELGEGVRIGPHVTVEAGVRIGPGTEIQAGCFVGHRSRLGRDCRLHPNVTLRHDTVLGDRVVVQAGSVLGGDGYGFVLKDDEHYKIPQIGHVEVEDDVEIGCCVTIDRATMGRTLIERGCKIDNQVQIGHNVVLGRCSLLVSQVGISGSTRIGPGTRFGGQSGCAGHLEVGESSTVAARGGVTKSLPAGSFVSGFPARPHRQERRIVASLNRLPELFRRVKALERADGTPGDPED